MEATERSVSNETSLFPDGITDDERRILEVLRKAKVREDRHMTKERISTELGAHGHEVAGIWHEVDWLRKKGIITERVDTISKESCFVLANEMPKSVIHRQSYKSVAAAALRAKVKQLYEEGLKYEEIRLQLGIPRGTVSTVVRRLIANREVKPRGQGKRGPKTVAIAAPPSPTFLELHEHGPEEANRDLSDDEEEDDELETKRELHPDVAVLMDAFETFRVRVQEMGWHVEVQLKFSFPGSLEKGAS